MNKQITDMHTGVRIDTANTVSICFAHRWVEGMIERIKKGFPNVTHITMKGNECVACTKQV